VSTAFNEIIKQFEKQINLPETEKSSLLNPNFIVSRPPLVALSQIRFKDFLAHSNSNEFHSWKNNPLNSLIKCGNDFEF
jgi:hypothetical protein